MIFLKMISLVDKGLMINMITPISNVLSPLYNS